MSNFADYNKKINDKKITKKNGSLMNRSDIIDMSRKEGVENKNLQSKSRENLQDFAHAILRVG